jgi:DNA invertase Pin-like site-specific DNA recombinase
MVGQHVGYIRVSSIGQNTERQLEGVPLDEVYTEKASAKNNKRPKLIQCLRYLRKGDCLHVHSIDRLARNLVDLQTIIIDLNGKGVSVQFHKEGLTFSGDESPMNKLMLQMMGAFAEFERNLIRERQAEGIASAKKRGVKFGKEAKLTPEQIEEIKDLIARRHSKTEIAKQFNVSRQTIYNAIGTDQTN